MNRLLITTLLCLVVSAPNIAENLNEKVARNAAHCLTGHVAINSEKYQSGKTSSYLLLIERTVGTENVEKYITASIEKLKTSIRVLESSKNDERKSLVKKFCPEIDSMLDDAS
jgi:hypothetical protein